MSAGAEGASLVHSHTWYANLGGHLAKLIHAVPHVATVHSLEPLRPWKAEQLGGGYALSCFCERTGLESADAIIGVSGAMRDDILRTYPAIDPGRVSVVAQRHRHATSSGPTPARASSSGSGSTRRRRRSSSSAASPARRGSPTCCTPRRCSTPPSSSCSARAPRTRPSSRRRSSRAFESLRDAGHTVLWIEEMLPRPELIQVLSHATVFVCPSVYEPLGIVNLEAMACETPVVATARRRDPRGRRRTASPACSSRSSSATTARASRSTPPRSRATSPSGSRRCSPTPGSPRRFGRAGRERAVEEFGWPAIAERVVEVYRGVVA